MRQFSGMWEIAGLWQIAVFVGFVWWQHFPPVALHPIFAKSAAGSESSGKISTTKNYGSGKDRLYKLRICLGYVSWVCLGMWISELLLHCLLRLSDCCVSCMSCFQTFFRNKKSNRFSCAINCSYYSAHYTLKDYKTRRNNFNLSLKFKGCD